MNYKEFLAAKGVAHAPTGIPDPPALNPMLKAHQPHCTRWALQRGRSALFEECGLGKTWQGLEWAHRVIRHTAKPVLVMTPLAVTGQWVTEANKLWDEDCGPDGPIQIREESDVEGDSASLYVCNYERLDRLSELLPLLGGVVLDESSILKAYDGKTRTKLIEAFQHVAFRLALTATPSPNDVTELGNHAEFLGAMSRVEMLATFFCHDGGDTSVWRLKGHAEKDFWAWVRTWAMCVSKPSDMGYSDDGYELPPLELVEHVVDVDFRMARQAGLLFAFEASTLTEQRAVKRDTLAERVALASELVNGTAGQWLVFCDLNDESTALAKAIAGAVEVTGSDSAEDKERAILGFIAGESRVMVSKSSIVGFGLNLQCAHQIAFAGSDHSYERFHQAVRRCWRFGQRHPVQVHLFRTSADGRVAHNLERKRLEHEAMVRSLVAVTGGGGERRRITGGTAELQLPSFMRELRSA